MSATSWRSREKATLYWAALLSVAAHASVFCCAAQPQANRPGARLAATLVAYAARVEASTPTPPPSAVAPSATSADAARQRAVGTARRSGPPALRYYAPAELDKRSFPLAMLEFPYPAVAGERRQGTLELTLYVGSEGVVDRVEVDFSSVDPRLVELAVAALRTTPFSPGERQGRAVGARWRLAVDYALVGP